MAMKSWHDAQEIGFLCLELIVRKLDFHVDLNEFIQLY